MAAGHPVVLGMVLLGLMAQTLLFGLILLRVAVAGPGHFSKQEHREDLAAAALEILEREALARQAEEIQEEPLPLTTQQAVVVDTAAQGQIQFLMELTPKAARAVLRLLLTESLIAQAVVVDLTSLERLRLPEEQTQAVEALYLVPTEELEERIPARAAAGTVGQELPGQAALELLLFRIPTRIWPRPLLEARLIQFLGGSAGIGLRHLDLSRSNMAHFAEINQDNLVVRVLVVPDSEEHRGQQFLADDLLLGGRWVQTSYNGRIRKNYAGIGFTYDEQRDAFIPPKPSEDAILDEDTCNWKQATLNV